METEYERSLASKDIQKILNIDGRQAYEFLRKYGLKVGGVYVIPRNEFAMMRLDGTVTEFLKWLETRRKVYKD